MTDKLPRVTADDAIRALERAGFFLARQSGSHKIFSFKRDLIRFRPIKPSGDPQMMRARLEGDKLSIPEAIIQQAGLRDGDEVEVGLEDGKVVIKPLKPLVSLAKFKGELRGCVESSKVDPLEAKRIWKE